MQGPMRSTKVGTATHQFHCILLAKQFRAGTVSKGGAINSILDGRSFKVMLKGACIKRGMDSCAIFTINLPWKRRFIENNIEKHLSV